MARPLRVEFAGAWYHVTARGNERRAIFRSDVDRARFVELLGLCSERFRLRIHGYVLMSNHYHLLVETAQANLSRAMQWLGVSYTVWFNRRHGRSGHLFQGRFKAFLVDGDERGAELSRYLHLNPIRVGRFGLGKRAREERRAGMGEADGPEVISARRRALRQYRWSSYRAYIGLETAPPLWLGLDAVRRQLGGRRQTAAQTYRQYVEQALRDGPMESPLEQVEAQLVLGGAALLARARKVLGRASRREQPGARTLRRRDFDEAIAVTSRLKGEPWEEFRDRYGDWGRDMALWLGRTQCGLKLMELGELVGGLDPATVSVATMRWQARIARDKTLMKTHRQAIKLLNAEM